MGLWSVPVYGGGMGENLFALVSAVTLTGTAAAVLPFPAPSDAPGRAVVLWPVEPAAAADEGRGARALQISHATLHVP